MMEESKEYAGNDSLVRAGLLGGEEQQRALAEQLGIAVYTDLSEFQLPRDLYQKLSYSFVKRHTVLPVQQQQDTLIVAVADPLNLAPLQDISLLFDMEVQPIYTSKEAIQLAINEGYNQHPEAASQMLADLTKRRTATTEDGEIEVYDLLDNSPGQAPVVKLLNLILTEAIQQGTSDIHFEPQETGVKVRYRIDGVLQTRHTPTQEFRAQLLTRIKVMAKLDIAEHRLPQDGRIKLIMGPREIDFRVSTVPINEGERIVLRILDKGNVMLGLDRLGMLPQVYDEFRRLIAIPEGIVLVTGPTGSGKTTTLYSAISGIYSDETNIMTIEDPVEYNLKGIAQIGVQPKIQLDFARGLRHILRQDPDIIMIGEIRDVETAEIAIQAALTGHLVLSTLHTNDAPSAITRLVDMGVEPYLLSSCVVGVLAQRLVRRICRGCKHAYKPHEQELQNLGITHADLKGGHLFRGEGCPLCFGTGYKGRHGLYELMSINNALKRQIVKSPDAVELRRIGLETGMVALVEHGAALAIEGITSVSEVLRAARGAEDL
jgi:general secretion pathway protein E